MAGPLLHRHPQRTPEGLPPRWNGGGGAVCPCVDFRPSQGTLVTSTQAPLLDLALFDTILNGGLMLFLPAFGSFSDRLATRWGRRCYITHHPLPSAMPPHTDREMASIQATHHGGSGSIGGIGLFGPHVGSSGNHDSRHIVASASHPF